MILLSLSVSAFNFSEDFEISNTTLRENYDGYWSSNLATSINVLNDSYWYIENGQLVINATNSTDYYLVMYNHPSALLWSDYETNLSMTIDNQVATSHIGVAVHSSINESGLNTMEYQLLYMRFAFKNIEYLLSEGFKVGDDTSENNFSDGAKHNFNIITNNNNSDTTFPVSLQAKIWNESESIPNDWDINISVGGGGVNLITNGTLFYLCADAICYFDDISAVGTGNDTQQPINCTPDWTCAGYDFCGVTDEAFCNSSIDLNSCNESYTGNYSEFVSQPCDYCSSNLFLLNTSVCMIGFQYVYYEDLNYETCCNLTQLPSDCPFGNFSMDSWLVSCGNFEAEYNEEDISGIIIDIIVKILLTLSIFIGLIIFILFGKWAYNKVTEK